MSGADIVRIENDLGLSFWEFACRWADPDGQIARNAAPHFYFADEPGTPFVICLIHSDSAVFRNTTKCRFLTECPPDREHPLGVARCGIYGSRPSACRGFPAKLSDDGGLAVISEVPASGRSDGHPAHQLCPEPWTANDFDRVQVLQDLIIARYEMTIFHQLAELWNRNPQPWSVFPDFLHIVYSQRVQTEAEYEARHSGPRILKFPQAEDRIASRAA